MSSVYNSQLDAFELYHKIQEDDTAFSGTEGAVGLPALGHALAGSAGTAISHLALYPLSLAITRLQVQKQLRQPNEAASAAEEADIEYKGIQDAIQKIYRSEGGLKAFYAGCWTDTSKSIVDAFLFFLAYTFLRQKRQQARGHRSLPVTEEIAVGMAAGAFSKFVTTPIQQIVTRKQTASMVAARDPTSSGSKDLSLKEIAMQIRKERGISGFWAGYSASLILTLNPSLTFLFENLLKRTVLPASKRDNPGPKLVFLIAALSKAAASTVMYPFSLAKTRAQIAASSPSPAVEEQESLPIEISEKAESTGHPRVQKAEEESRGLLRFVTRHIRQPAVIKSLGQIYRTEGFLALYSGLEGEVLKGFLGHGLTMLLKERIHVTIIKTYFYILKLLRKWPDNLGSVGDHTTKEIDRVRRVVGGVATDVKEGAENVAETVKEGAVNAVSGDAPSATGVEEKLENVATTVREGALNAASGSIAAAGDVKQRLENIAVTVKEGAVNAVSGKKED